MLMTIWSLSAGRWISVDSCRISRLQLRNCTGLILAGNTRFCILWTLWKKEDAFYSLKNGYLKRRAGYYIYYAQKSFALSAIIDDERKKDTSIQKKQNEKQEMMQEDNQKEKNQEQESWSEHFLQK